MSLLALIGTAVAIALGSITAWVANGALRERKGRELERQQDRIENARIREEQAAVPRPADADVVDKLRGGKF